MSSDTTTPEALEQSDLVDLTEPLNGVPAVTTSPEQLAAVVAKITEGSGPVAVDAERASGYRYGQHNYLVQFFRADAGTFLIDPIALPDLSSLSQALADTEWVFHAANQDIEPLREQGLVPPRIFDTEVAARLLGLPRVGLGAVVAELLGLRLAKEHSAVDWSTRPLPESWLKYAALDVEVLPQLRHRLAQLLDQAGKLSWALEEFEAIRTAPAHRPRIEPWRRISRISELRNPRALAIARELWLVRDRNAQQREISPGRVLSDRAIIAAAKAQPRTVPALLELREFAGRANRQRAQLWLRAITDALALPESQLPTLRGPVSDAPPQPRVWKDRAPLAALRWEKVRPAMIARAEELNLPVENLMQPDTIRRLCWDTTVAADSVAEFLAAHGARPWQIEQSIDAICTALNEVQTD